MKRDKRFTFNSGAPVDDDQNSVSTGIPGPTLMQDTHLMEKLAHFDRERIPERVVHAKGAGAFGVFEVTHDISQYTCADFLSEVGKKTEVFARFSTVGGERGSADAARDPRGFAVKFYTEEGNYDLVGNNTPIFFIRDAIKFPDFIHTQKRNPKTNLKDPDMFWDFLSLTPESLHQTTILFSDRGTPATYRHMHGYGSHTFMMYDKNGEYVWVKFHWRSEQGIKNLTGPEAEKMTGDDPDHATRDLYQAIEKGDYPSWTLELQIMTPEEAERYPYDIFDITKVWFHGDYPRIPVGRMTLNRNPENYFADVEQAAFAPGNFVPGIGPSPDKLLQGRFFSYPDTHRHRLGPNFDQIPVNAPKAAKKRNYQRDSFMAIDGNGGSEPNYYPNSMGGPEPDQSTAIPPIDVSGMAARHEYKLSDKDFEQPGELYRRAMNDTDRANLIANIAGHLGGAQERLQYRQTALFFKADPDYGRRVAEALGLNQKRVEELAKMTQEERVQATS